MIYGTVMIKSDLLWYFGEKKRQKQVKTNYISAVDLKIRKKASKDRPEICVIRMNSG